MLRLERKGKERNKERRGREEERKERGREGGMEGTEL